MDREEFLRVWDRLPDLKRAELIDGVVYVASPVSKDHASFQFLMGAWLSLYTWKTPACEMAGEGTWKMLDSAPQPDVHLVIRPECGGQSGFDGTFTTGAPELAVEICVSSREYDFGPKLALYQRAGVREYITVETFSNRIVWRELVDGSYRAIEPELDGSLRSRMFPGLWLDVEAFLNRRGPEIQSFLERGLSDPAHAGFVERFGPG